MPQANRSRPQYGKKRAAVAEIKFTQNFLHSPALVAKIVALAGIVAGETVLEIGPGKGIISAELTTQVTATGRVVAVELDADLLANLQQNFANTTQLELVQADILAYDLRKLGSDYRVFSNVPFNITSVLLSHLFSPENGPHEAHLILQRDTLIGTNKAGYKTETLKSLMLKPLYAVEPVYQFAGSDFRPRPSVETALFAFTRRAAPLIELAQLPSYQDFIAFVSKDRVGEGVWQKLFSKRQLTTLAKQSDLVLNRGLKSQTFEAILHTYAAFATLPQQKRRAVDGALEQLRGEQQHRDNVSRSGGHHRTKQGRR